MNLNKNSARFIWCLILILSAIYVVSNVKFEANILKLLPKYESSLTSALIDKTTAKINDKLIIVIANKSQEKARLDFLKLTSEIEQSDLFKNIQSEIDFDQIQLLYQQLYKYRYLMMTQDDQQAIIEHQDNAYFIELAMTQLYGLNGLNENQIKEDPLFFFQRVINQLSEFNQTHMDTDDGLFHQFKNGKHHYFAIVQLQISAFSPHYQEQVVNVLNETKNQLIESDLLGFGSVLYAQQAYAQAKNEISTVGLGSLVGILLLFIIVFGSLTPLIVSLLSIALALLFALAVSFIVFTKIHLFALVFGSTIAGVSIDYCFHYLCHSLVTNNQRNKIKDILPGLMIGFFSSATVYIGFVITGYEVLAQISLFSICGLLAVLINVLLFFPLMIKPKKINTRRYITSIAGKLSRNPLSKLFDTFPKISVLFLLAIGVNWLWLIPNDDVRALQNLSPELKVQEQKIRNLLEIPDTARYALVHAHSIDELLTIEQSVISQLREGDHSIIGISDVFPSRNQQKHNNLFYQEIYQSNAFYDYIISNGLDKNIATNLVQNLSIEKNIDEALLNNPVIQKLLSQRWLGKITLNQDDIYALTIPLSDNQVVVENEQIVMVEQVKDTSELFANFRVKSIKIVMISVLLLWLLLALLRYGIKKSAHILMLPVFAGLCALMATQILGFHISLFSFLALLLILGMGIDYVVFLIESHGSQHVMLAITLSSVTTILSFGLLSLSNVAVIKSFGFTVVIGILTILFISPAIIKHGKNHA